MSSTQHQVRFPHENGLYQPGDIAGLMLTVGIQGDDDFATGPLEACLDGANITLPVFVGYHLGAQSLAQLLRIICTVIIHHDDFVGKLPCLFYYLADVFLFIIGRDDS